MVATILTNAAETNRAVLRYLSEATWGTTPASGTVKQMRIVSSGLQAKKTTKLSEEIRADRMVSNIIEVAAMTDGDIEWELSAGGQDEFWAQFLLSNWTLDMNYLLVKGSSVSVVTTSKIRLAGKDWTAWLAANQYLKVEGFLSTFNNGYFKISSVSYTGGNTDIITVETSLVVEAGSAYTKVMDASDVILKSTATAITSGNTINGGGANSFAGKTFFPGQKIFMEGLGKEAGSIAFNPTAPTDNQTFKVSDGINELTFEFAVASATASPGNVYVATASDPSTRADNFVAAVMDQLRKQNFRVSAKKTAGVKQTGTIAFSDDAAVGDKFTLTDGNGQSHQFTFVASGGTGLNVDKGADATDTGANLAAAIITAFGGSLSAASVTGTVTVTNNLYTGGSITEDVDSASAAVVTDFNSGTKPGVALVNHRATGGSITEALTAITASAFASGDAAKGGFLTIASVPNDDTLVVSETITVDANGGSLMVVIKGSHIRNPGDPTLIVKKSISAETGFTDVGKYLSHNGLRLGSFKKTIVPGDIVKGSFSFMGRETRPLDASVIGLSPYVQLETTNEEVFNGTSNVGEVLRNGAALTTAILKLEVNGDAALRQQNAVGAKFPAGIGYGRFVLKGSFDAYFQNFDLYRDFLNHTTASIAWTLEDADHMKYYFTIPAVKYTADPITPDGIDKDVIESIQWTAQRDPALGTMMMVDRFSSVFPMTVAA